MMTMTGAFLKARTTEIADKMLSVREVKIISRFFVFVFFFNFGYNYKLGNRNALPATKKMVIPQLTAHFARFFVHISIHQQGDWSPEYEATGPCWH